MATSSATRRSRSPAATRSLTRPSASASAAVEAAAGGEQLEGGARADEGRVEGGGERRKAAEVDLRLAEAASSAATTRSQLAASSRPPPRQRPRTAAMVTAGSARSRASAPWKVASIGSTRSGVWSWTDTPAEKARSPAAATTTTWRSGSAARSARARSSASRVARSRMLSGGRLRVSRATRPSRAAMDGLGRRRRRRSSRLGSGGREGVDGGDQVVPQRPLLRASPPGPRGATGRRAPTSRRSASSTASTSPSGAKATGSSGAARSRTAWWWRLLTRAVSRPRMSPVRVSGAATRDRVGEGVERAVEIVLAGVGELRGEVLPQGAAEEDVEHLHAAADPPDRHRALPRPGQQLEVEGVALRQHAQVPAGERLLAVGAGIEVGAAGEHHPRRARGPPAHRVGVLAACAALAAWAASGRIDLDALGRHADWRRAATVVDRLGGGRGRDQDRPAHRAPPPPPAAGQPQRRVARPALHQGRESHAARHAEGGDAVADAAPGHAVEQGDEDAGAGGADGVARGRWRRRPD